MSPGRSKQRIDPVAGIAETGVILIDLSFRVIAQDQGAPTILTDFRDPGTDQPPPLIPRRISEVVRARNLNSISGLRVKLQGATSVYRCTIYKVEPPDLGSAPAMLALHFQRGLSADDAIDQIAKAGNLTEREVEVLRGLSIGMTSKEIALRMSISPNTVKSYIRLIMVEIRVTTRSGIVGKLLEYAASSDA